MDTGSFSVFLLSSVFAVSLYCPCVAYGDAAPCDLLSQNQVSAIVGANVGEASPIANTGCSWKGTGASKVLVSVSMQSEKMFTGVKNSATQQKTPMPGIGDEAIFTGMDNFASLWVRKGSKFLLVRIYGVTLSDAQAKLKALAIAATSKL